MTNERAIIILTLCVAVLTIAIILLQGEVAQLQRINRPRIVARSEPPFSFAHEKAPLVAPGGLEAVGEPAGYDT